VLIEALVAVAVIGVALLFLVALLAHEARLAARAPAQRAAEQLLELAIEEMRAGLLPIESTSFSSAAEWSPLAGHGGTVMWIVATELDAPNLWEVTVKVRYRAGRDLLERSLTTRVWTG
jgi:type II secretory pathway pseudopilin PulG